MLVDNSGLEPCFSVNKVARAKDVSRDTIIRLFENEPGVIVLGSRNSSGGKRRYRTLRIPRSVVEHVFAGLANPGRTQR